MNTPEKYPYDTSILKSVKVSHFLVNDLIELLIGLDSKEYFYSVFLVGIPAAISCREDVVLRNIYGEAFLCIVDGMPIVKKLRGLGIKNERCSAPDFMVPLMKQSVEKNKTHYFYGGKSQEVLNELIENVKKTCPGINIVGSYCPPFRALTKQEDEDVVAEINRLKPDFIWVGIGAPKQEKWIYEHKDIINSGIAIGVGAGFDFISGNLKKAPKFIEKMSLEWLFRLIKEPKRLFKRYVIGGFKYIKYSMSDFFNKR